MRRRKKKTQKQQAAAYDAKMAGARADSASKSRAGRNIGDIPKVKDPKRKRAARESCEFFLRTYLPDTFYLPWSNDHRKAIEKIEMAVRSGGLFAYAMPRGSGKTSIAQGAMLWAVLNGFRRFGVLIGAEADAASENLFSIKSELENNSRLIEDYPEVCYPIGKLEGIAHRCAGQLYKDRRTNIEWTSDQIVLPTIKDSQASAAIIKVTGITGRIRGMSFKRPDGGAARPDFCLVDDPQTNESARSPSQVDTRLRLLRQDVLGLAGPGKKISGVMPCTVICPGDLADQCLDQAKHPEWHGERSKLLVTIPGNTELWEQYRQLRADSLRAGNGGRDSTEFYRANREEMDRGGEAAWAIRHNPDEISAIQHGMNLKFDLGDEAFFSEYQNDPLPLIKLQPDALKPDAICAKVNGWPRGTVPIQATRLTAFIDVQKQVLPWLVLATGEGFEGWIVDYGVYPEQHGRDFYKFSDCRNTLERTTGEKSVEAWLRSGLEGLTDRLLGKEWKRSDGTAFKIEGMLIDAGWMSELVCEFCRASKYAAMIKPSRGEFHGAKTKLFSEYRRQTGDRMGLNWRISANQKRAARLVQFDSNWWKTFVAARLNVPMGARACYSLFGREAYAHRMFAEHLCSEMGTPVTAKGKTVVEWNLKVEHDDNHWWDCIVGASVAASMHGAALSEQILGGYQRQRKRVDFTSTDYVGRN